MDRQIDDRVRSAIDEITDYRKRHNIHEGCRPKNTMMVQWGEAGYLVVDIDELKKLPAKQRNAIYKLGGTH